MASFLWMVLQWPLYLVLVILAACQLLRFVQTGRPGYADNSTHSGTDKWTLRCQEKCPLDVFRYRWSGERVISWDGVGELTFKMKPKDPLKVHLVRWEVTRPERSADVTGWKKAKKSGGAKFTLKA